MTPAALLALAAVLVVSPAGPYRTLGEALRDARPGDRIVVRGGEYRGAGIVVDRRVEITGEGWPVLDGGGAGTVLRITADSVVIRGLVVQGTGAVGSEDRAGIRLESVRGARVVGNRVRDAYFGIYGERARDGVISGNEVYGPGTPEGVSGNAIHCWSCEGMTIADNLVTGHRDGIYLEFTDGSQVTGNRVVENLRYGLHFMFSNDCRYAGNLFRANGAGIAVMYSRRVTVDSNRFEASRGASAYGLLLKEISDSRIRDNTFLDNTVALYLENANRNAVEGNLFHGNGRAVRVLANATGNVFRDNRFEGNSFDVTTNSRSASSTFERNYWDRYRGYDLDGDGFGDVAFRPVRLFGLLVEQNDPAIILLRSPFVDLLDVAERVFPVLTPEALADARPRMRPEARP